MLKRLVLAAAAAFFVVTAGATPSSAQRLVPCAPENGYCNPPYPTTVIYGVGNRTTSREVADRGIACNNRRFGDPAPGQVKQCWYITRGGGGGGGWGGGWGGGGGSWGGGGGGGGWRVCAAEHGYCSFRGNATVRYGANGQFTERSARNGVACSNRVFGDPAPGQVKQCFVRD